MNLPLPLHEYILALLGSVALAALIVRLAASGLARLYKYFFIYLVVDLVQTAEPFFIRFRTNWYGHVFLTTEALMVCLYALIIFELYSVLLQELEAIEKTAQRYTAAALVLSIVIAVLLRTALPLPSSLIEKFFYFESAIVLSLVLFIFLITAFIVYFPKPLHRNAIVYSMGYAVYFLSKATLLFLNNAGSSAWTRACSTAAMVVSTGCIIFWAVYLNREGECRTVIAGHRWSTPGDRQRVLKGLHALNHSLLRSRGK